MGKMGPYVHYQSSGNCLNFDVWASLLLDILWGMAGMFLFGWTIGILLGHCLRDLLVILWLDPKKKKEVGDSMASIIHNGGWVWPSTRNRIGRQIIDA